MSSQRKFQDWERVRHRDGREGVIGNYDHDMRLYVVLWDGNGWEYVDYKELESI